MNGESHGISFWDNQLAEVFIPMKMRSLLNKYQAEFAAYKGPLNRRIFEKSSDVDCLLILY